MSETPSTQPVLRPVRIVNEDGVAHRTRILGPKGDDLAKILRVTHIVVALGRGGFTEVTLGLTQVPVDVVAHLSDSTLAQLARQIADTRDMERSNGALAVLRMLTPKPVTGGQ